MLQDKYKRQIDKCETDLQKHSKVFNIVGYIKLAALIIFIVTVYFTLSNGFSVIFCIAGIVILLLQVFLWIYHANISDKINYTKSIIAINKQYLDRISGDWVDFDDIGQEFIDKEHPFAFDLDIVGKRSLFQLLNVTNTWHGRQKFANDLLNADYSLTELHLRQDAISELSNNIEFSARIQYFLSKIGTSNFISAFLQELKSKTSFIKSVFFKCFVKYFPYLTITFIAVMLIFQLKNLYFAGIILLLIQAIIWSVSNTKTSRYLGAIADLPYRLARYSALFDILGNEKFTCEKLSQIKEKLNLATQPIKELDKISRKINARRQGIVCLILNVLFLWDYKCIILLDAWKDRYANSCEEWFVALGEFESLLSFSNLVNICSNVTLPVITSKSKTFEATDLGHPLIENSARVTNSIVSNNSILIISGSNMSGKTTFLRTVGINLVLANAGSFVCAKSMTCSLFKIITSMRISDDLSEGVSTFYAELKKVKRIIDAAKNHEHIIFLIDEIFRGTNSVDRLYGAKTVIAQLDSMDTMGIITTHDLELCELENQLPRIKNYSFSEHYEANKILFDYKIKQGKSNTTNAKYLMQILGIL